MRDALGHVGVCTIASHREPAAVPSWRAFACASACAAFAFRLRSLCLKPISSSPGARTAMAPSCGVVDALLSGCRGPPRPCRDSSLLYVPSGPGGSPLAGTFARRRGVYVDASEGTARLL